MTDADNQQALDALVAIDPRNEEGVLSASLLRAVTAGRLPFVRSAIAAHPSELEPWRAELAEMALQQLADNDDAFAFAVAQASFLGSAQKDALVQKLVGHFAATAATRDMANLLQAALDEPGLKGKRDVVVRELWERAKPIDPAPLALLQLIVPHLKRLDKGRREAFVQRVQEWIGAGVPLLDAVSRAALNDGERETIVRSTVQHVNASIANTDIAQRQQFFGLAERLAEGSAGATRQIEEAINVLPDGTEADRQLYNLLRPSANPD
jgi:hypothetical protein